MHAWFRKLTLLFDSIETEMEAIALTEKISPEQFYNYLTSCRRSCNELMIEIEVWQRRVKERLAEKLTPAEYKLWEALEQRKNLSIRNKNR